MFILCVLDAVLPSYYPISVLSNLPNFVISWICWENWLAYFSFLFKFMLWMIIITPIVGKSVHFYHGYHQINYGKIRVFCTFNGLRSFQWMCKLMQILKLCHKQTTCAEIVLDTLLREESLACSSLKASCFHYEANVLVWIVNLSTLAAGDSLNDFAACVWQDADNVAVLHTVPPEWRRHMVWLQPL